MNESQRRECEKLQAFSSKEAADYLIAFYGVDSSSYGEVFNLLPHRSWKRSDQVRLARHYFQKVPFANSRPYEVFASFMSLPLLIELLEEFAPVADDKVGLFCYYVEPVLKHFARGEREVLLVESFLRNVEAKAQQAVAADRPKTGAG